MSGGYDIAIVGGGLVGAATAYGLAKAGRRVVLIDEGDHVVRASRANFALVWVQGKGLGMPEYARWSVGSANAWRGLADDLSALSGIDVHLQQPGGFNVCMTETEMEARRTMLMRFHNQPGVVEYKTEMLGHAELKRYFPDLGPEVAGASYSPLDGHVNSLKLYRALHTSLQRLGVTYLPDHAVTAIHPGRGSFRLETPRRTLEAGKVVLAAGNANLTLAPMVGLSAPMKPERGQIIVTERVAPFMKYPIGTLRQTDEGTVMIGDSREILDDPTGMRHEISTVMADRAVRIFPKLARLNIVRIWSGIRVMPADGFPIYDQSESHPGAFIATCHSGVTLAAAHALSLAPMIDRGGLDPWMKAFSAGRFDVQAAA